MSNSEIDDVALAVVNLVLTARPPTKLKNEGPPTKSRGRRGGKNKRNQKSDSTSGGNLSLNKNAKKVVRKSVGYFKCSGDSCGKAWSSVHAWTSRNVTCDLCDSKAKILNFKDEECELDFYACPSCNNGWQSIHTDVISQQVCDICEVEVSKEEIIQKRFGRHYWYKCKNSKICGGEWEDFYQGKVYSQRCKICHATGILHQTKNLSLGEIQYQRQQQGRKKGGGSGGNHDVDGCDMCQKMQGDRVARSCRRKKLVVFELNAEKDGSTSERILAAL